MTTGKTLHLSQLSRGVGKEYPKYSHFGHHKINVSLEPQDYFNWVEKKSKKVFRLSPLPNVSKVSSIPQSNATAISVPSKEIILPKTFTTRKGALFLFSENALGDTLEREEGRDQPARNEGQEEKQDAESLDFDLRTVGQLSLNCKRTVGEFAKSILAYGNQHRKPNYVQLLTKIDNLQRQFRPGFSAKRYLSIWSKFWDHSTLDRLLKDGYIQSKSLFQMARLSSFHSRSLDDLSSQPLPYRLVHSMLQSNLQGYAFFRVINNEDFTGENNFAHQPYGELKVFDPGSNSQLNDSQEIFYGQLERCQQEQVLTDYLLQSTVHHAFKVHQLQSLLDAKSHQPVINLSDLPLNEVHPCHNHEFATKNKKRKALRAHYRKLERDRNLFLPPLVQNSAEPVNSCSVRPPSAPRIYGKDPETETFLPTISQKPCLQKNNPNPKICRMHMLPFIHMHPTKAAPAPPATAVDPDEDYVNYTDHLPLVPVVNIEPPTRHNSNISGSAAYRRTDNEKEYKTSEVSDDDLWMSLVNDRISPTPGFWENRMEELSKNQKTMEPEDANNLKTIEATALSGLSISPSASENTKMLKTSYQSMSVNKAYINQRKRPIRKGFVNVPEMKGSIIQAPGGEIVHVGGSLAYRKTVLPDISPNGKVLDKMEDEFKEQQRCQNPLPNIDDHFVTEEEELGTRSELRNLSKQREESGLSLLSAPKVVEMLTKNAYRMASFILDQDGTGNDLDDDIKMMTREVTRVLSSKNGVSFQDDNQTRLLYPEDYYSHTERETAHPISADDTDRRSSYELLGDQGLENVLVTHSLKGSSSTSSRHTPPQNGIDGDALSGLLGGVKPGHLYQAAVRGSSPLLSPSIPNQRNTVHTAIREMDVTTLQPAPHESELLDSARQTITNRISSHESRNQIHFKSTAEGDLLDEDMFNTHIVGRRLSQNLAQSPNSRDRRCSAELQVNDERGAPVEEIDTAREGAAVQPSLTEEGASRNIIIKMPEVIQTEEYDQATSIEEPDTASIEEETHRAMEPYQKIIGSASPNQETTEASDRKRLCSPHPDSDPAERQPFASNASKRATPGRSMSQNDANPNLVPKTKKGKNTPKEEFKVSRVDYAGELKRLYSRTENNKSKMADVKHGKSKPKEKKTGKAKSKQSKKQKMSKKHKKKNKSTNKSIDEIDEFEDRSTNQWESEDRTIMSGMDSTGNQDVENLQSPTDRNRSVKEGDAISTWIQDAADKAGSDVSDNEKGDNSESSEPAVPEFEEKDEDDEERDIDDDEQQAENSESEEQKKMMMELKRILTPNKKKTEDITESSETKSPEVAPYNMITSQEARAAERRARAAKRREQVERKRKEREEQLRREKEMAERQEKLRQELEEQRRLLEEERRLRKEQQEEERRRQEEEELAREVKRLQEMEAEKRRKDEHLRKLRQLKMQQVEEERKRQELLKRQKEEEEERRKAEEEMLAQMAEQERIEYEQKRQEEEERRMREEEEKRIRQEAEAKQLMEEAVRLAQENARRQAELEARFQFTQTLNSEAVGLTRCQAVTRAFVFSYFELLNLLGIENTDQQQQQQQQQQET